MIRIASIFLLSCLSFVQLETVDLSEEALAESINAFGSDILNGLNEDASPRGNVLVSPMSVYSALTLLHLAAEDETRTALDAVMKLSKFEVGNYTEIHRKLKDIRLKLTSNEDRLKFHETVLANGIFVQKDYPINDTYLHSTKTFYDSEAKNVDFSGHPQEATNIINNWISNSTQGRISNFYDSPVPSETIAVLVSALYFNARWRDWFEEKDTKKDEFDTGSEVMLVPMMNLRSDELYYEHEETLHYDSLSIPYSGNEYAMTIYLQHEQHRNDSALHKLFHNLVEKKKIFSNGAGRDLVHLKLPKMKFAWKKSLVEALKLGPIFAQSHLDRMTPKKDNVKISNMIHATELEVDEKGTIATAATALEAVATSGFVSAHPEPIPFYVDRPFLMAIVHNPTRTILFAGIIREPNTVPQSVDRMLG